MKNEPLQQEAGQPAATKNFIIDCDVHCIPQHPEQIRKHVPAEWQNRFMMSNRDLYSHPIYVIRTDSRPPSGLPPASDPDFLRKQLIDEYGMNHIVIIQRPFTNPIPNPPTPPCWPTPLTIGFAKPGSGPTTTTASSKGRSAYPRRTYPARSGKSNGWPDTRIWSRS